MPFENLSNSKIAGPATVLLSDASEPLEVAIAYTCPDTFAGIRTVPSWIGTKVGVRPKINAICVAVTCIICEDGVNCTVATSPGKAVSEGKAPVMLRAGKGLLVMPRVGVLGGHETMNAFANVKAWFMVREVYDSLDY